MSAGGHRGLQLFDPTTGKFWPAKNDRATDCIAIVDYEHHEIHDGSHFFNVRHVDVPANDILDIRFTTPDTTKWLHMTYQFETEAEYIADLYEGVTIVNPGTALTAINNDRNSTNTSGLTLFDYIVNVDVANANVDTVIASATLLLDVHTGTSGFLTSSGGSAKRENEIILKQNTSYSFRFANQSGTTEYVAWAFKWYEHTNKH